MNTAPSNAKIKIIHQDILIALITLVGITVLLMSLDVTSFIHEALHNISFAYFKFIIAVIVALLVVTGVFIARYFIRLNRLLAENEKAQNALKAHHKVKLQQNKLAAIGELSGGLAHEINNALVPAIGMSEILKKRLEKDSPDLASFVDTIYSSSMHARKIVQNVLAFARSQDTNSEICKSESVFHEAITIGQSIIADTNIRLAIDKPDDEDMYHINVNRTAISQMFSNLFKNAGDAMPTGGIITVKFEKQELGSDLAIQYELSECDHLIVSVSDTGSGIEDSVLNQIFDPFFTTKDVDKGTGLGLATVYGTMRNLGGNISVESEVGKGTTFTLYFPITDPDLFQLFPQAPSSQEKVHAHA